MLNKFKNLKLVKTLTNLSPKLRWMIFNQMQDYKINSEYVNMIASNSTKEVNSDNERLEAMVRESLVKEFSPDIENMKSYDLLVDAVVHNLKKKQLQTADGETKPE